MRHIWWIVAAVFGGIWVVGLVTRSAAGGLLYGFLVVSLVAILVRIINGHRVA